MPFGIVWMQKGAKEMTDTATIILILLLLTFFIKIVIDNGKLERDAIRLGYAIYDNNGVFQWRENRND